MGGVLGVVFPHGGGFYHQTGGVQLQNGGQNLVGHVLHKGIGGQVGDAAQIKFVAHTDDCPGILVGPFLGDFIAVTHFFHQQRRGDVRVQTPIHHELLEIVLPGGVEAGEGILKGTGAGYGEMVVIGYVQLLALLHQAVQRFVGIGVGLNNIVVEYQVIGGPVAHQHVAVAVQDIAPGGTDGGQGGINLGVVVVAVGFHDLDHKQLSSEQNQDKCEQSQKQIGPEAAYSFHVLPPIRPIL